jgi:benzoyl-CoA reductase/2-hydroxyglutaryl-CoA dehydratase subunit BcrC/BadD/HgdB
VEIITAAGMLPYRIVPKPAPAEADAWIHPQTCFFVKSLLAAALRGEWSQLSGLVLTNSCDAMSRLADLIREYAGDLPVIFLDVPKKRDADSIADFSSRLRNLASHLHEQYVDASGALSADRLNEAIRRWNHVRRLMAEVFALQLPGNPEAKASDIFRLSQEGVQSDPLQFVDAVKRFLKRAGSGKSQGHGPRVVVTGNAIWDVAWIESIENAGARVAVMHTCVGDRNYAAPVAEDTSDPLGALAARYLLKSPCARMMGIRERIQHLRDHVTTYKADGVICVAPKYCDFQLYEIPLLSESAGVPFLAFENDYRPDNEQMNARLEAFLEMLVLGGDHAQERA